MPISVNVLVLEEAIRHQIALARYNSGVVREMTGILDAVDDSLQTEIAGALSRLDEKSFTVQRLQSMLASTRAMNASAYDAVGKALTKELQDFVVYEAEYRAMMLANFLPVGVHVASLNVEDVYAAAMENPFQGIVLHGALDDLSAFRAKKIQTSIAQGFVENKTNQQIIRGLMGTKAANYRDGLLERSRKDVATVVQTAVSHMANFVADRAAEANADIVQAIRWSATLDNRTSETCRLRDGHLYDPITHEPRDSDYPWLGGPGRAHWNCRSHGVEVLKSFEELGLDEPEIDVKSTRASMDGQVPDDMTYFAWLKKQPAARQDEILGPMRAKLMRDGGLDPAQMYDPQGRYLKLDELRQQDAEAFRKAGI